MKKFRYFLEYIFFVGLGRILRLLSRRAVLFLGARAGDFIYYCVPIRKKLTMEQIARAFPEKSGREVAAICRQAYRNLAMNGLEHLCLPTLSRDELLDIVTFRNEELLEKAYSRGKGVIFVGGHFGNWEYMGAAISAKGYPLTYVVADIANPFIDDMVNRHRTSAGIRILTKGMSIRAMLKTLRDNGAMAMLMDQDAGRNGTFVDFFGRKCSTPKGPALFALKTGAAVLLVSSIRQADGSLRAVFEEVEIDHDRGVSEERLHEIMQRCTARMEEYIRKYPGQWLWMHRRWKTPPSIVEG